MKIVSLIRAILLSVGVSAIAAQAVQADALADIKQAKKVRIGIDLGLPPYGMMDAKLQATGLDVDVARLLAADLGVELELVSTTGASRIPNLQTNKADLIVSTLSITPERQKVIDFSVPYAPIQTIVFAPKSISIKSMADLAGKTVATSRGTGMDTQLTREAKGANIVRYEDDATLITAAVTGQSDIIGGTGSHLHTVNEKNPAREMETKFVMYNFLAGIGLRKNEPELKAWVDGWVKANLNNGKLNTIFQKYFKQDLPPEILSGGN